MQTILMTFMLFHMLTESSALLDPSARGMQNIVQLMFRCSSNQCALVAQIICMTSALAVTSSSGLTVERNFVKGSPCLFEHTSTIEPMYKIVLYETTKSQF